MGCDIEEYPFIFMNTPASLQILASVEMALMVWRCEYANTSHSYERPSLFFEQKLLSCKEVLVVPIPNPIEAQIDEKIVNIGQDLRKWISFHSDRDFLDADSAEAFRKCFKHIVVDFSGSIGGKASAMNMLNSGEFSDVVNYKIACTYCLEDQVKRFWPSVANESRIDVNSAEDDKCNLSFWNGWMKSGGNSITDTESVKRLMANAAFPTNVTAFDYFSKMLPDHERVTECISLLTDIHERCHPTVICSLLFRTLDRVQSEEVLEEVVYSIFVALSLENVEYAHQLWTLMGHFILKCQLYHCVVIDLWTLVQFVTFHRCGLNYSQYGQINNLLLEIWSDASDEQKADVSDCFLGSDLLQDFPDGPGDFSRPTGYGRDMTFVLEVMSKWSDKDKENAWENYWPGLALCSKPLYLEQFMRMCLPNNDDIEFFKNEIAEFEYLFRSLIEQGFYSDLKDYLIFCANDEKQWQQQGKEVLESNLDVVLLHDDEKLAKFEWFVGEVFANVQKDVEEFKIVMISSAKCLKRLLTARQADKISSNDFSKVVGRFFTNEAELQQVKREFLKHCPTYLVECTPETFNADQWQEFLEWCTADHEGITTFKGSLNVDVIFLKRVQDYLDGECYVEGFEFLDNFLKWYFGNEEAAKNFKLEKVKNYKEIDSLRVETSGDFTLVIGILYKLLVWLFDNNTKNASEFCKTCFENRCSSPY